MSGGADELVESNWDLVKEVAGRHFTGRRGDDDLLQMGYIGLWEATKSWNGSGSFREYARFCVYHNMIDHVRKPPRPTGEWPIEDEDGEEVMYYDDLAVMELCDEINKRYQRGTDEHTILTMLAVGHDKQAVAARLGWEMWKVTRAAKRAVKGLNLGKKRPVGE